MKKWIKILITIVITIIVFVIGVNIIYHFLITDCCSCCDDSAEICISACCECNYNTFDKIHRIIEYLKK